MTARYARSARLTQTAQYSAVFGFRCVVRCGHFAIFARPRSPPPSMAEAQQTARLGMSVARKVAARAVDRNYMKRVIREVFRRHQSEFEGIDFVVAPRRVFSRRNYAAIEVELLGALLKARGKCLASCNG